MPRSKEGKKRENIYENSLKIAFELLIKMAQVFEQQLKTYICLGQSLRDTSMLILRVGVKTLFTEATVQYGRFFQKMKKRA